MKKYKYILVILIILFTINIYSNNNTEQNLLFLPGSNIYTKVFLFFFPITDKYDAFFNLQKNHFNLEIFIKKENIRQEPSTPAYFDTDLIFHIKDIPYNKSDIMILPVTIRCNKKFIKKKVKLTIYNKENIIIIKGNMSGLTINEITDNEYFKNRFDWQLPIHFDIRLQLEGSLVEKLIELE